MTGGARRTARLQYLSAPEPGGRQPRNRHDVHDPLLLALQKEPEQHPESTAQKESVSNRETFRNLKRPRLRLRRSGRTRLLPAATGKCELHQTPSLDAEATTPPETVPFSSTRTLSGTDGDAFQQELS